MRERITVRVYRKDGSGTWYWGYPRKNNPQKKFMYRHKRLKYLFIDVRL